MKSLLEFLLKGITASDKFEVEEVNENSQTNLFVKADPEIIGLIIGKGGKTIKNLRKILSIKAVLIGAAVSIDVTEKNFTS